METEIPAPVFLVWSVITGVERWPEWTASVSRLRVLTPGPLRVGSRVRIHQPKFPPAYWRVTEFESERQFTWVSVAPGARVTARHAIELCDGGCRVLLTIEYEGWFGVRLARWTQRLNEAYLAMEAEGLKQRSLELAKKTGLFRAFPWFLPDACRAGVACA